MLFAFPIYLDAEIQSAVFCTSEWVKSIVIHTNCKPKNYKSIMQLYASHSAHEVAELIFF